jgi:hypothetical protein
MKLNEIAQEDPDSPLIWDLLRRKLESKIPVQVVYNGQLVGPLATVATVGTVGLASTGYVIYWFNEMGKTLSTSMNAEMLNSCTLKKVDGKLQLDITWNSAKIPRRMAEEIEDADLPIVYDLIRAKLKTGTVIDMVQAQLPKAKIKRRITSLEAFAPDRVELFWEWTEKKDTDWFYPKVATCDYSVEDMERWQLSKTPTGWNLDMRETK